MTFKRGMNLFGSAISTLVNTALLSIVYILGVGITSISAQSKGKKFLDIKKKENKEETYWSDLTIAEDQQSYYRQF